MLDEERSSILGLQDHRTECQRDSMENEMQRAVQKEPGGGVGCSRK